MVIILSIVLLLSGCIGTLDREKNFGYPTVVRFPAEGGTEILKGERVIYGMTLGDRKGAIPSHDSINVQLDWLTAKNARGECMITLIASPNDDSKTRQMLVEVRSGYEYDMIKVVQDGKIE